MTRSSKIKLVQSKIDVEEYGVQIEGNINELGMIGELDDGARGSPIEVMENLRERFFDPSYELLSHDKYHDIWAFDDKNPLTRPAEGGESVGDVACRLAEAMEIMESQFQGHFGIAET
ncbi:hypothetical protein C1H46_003324 [Malus baccata]|uniref:Uncharacterized protein n=1 Tax=Malus baccata TaxID=106549 RepID=A0A540NJ56_MALBA|nr:hypothetical protein C1H46_003324 [Malus baccata]